MSKRSLTYGFQPVLETLELVPSSVRKLYLSTRRKRNIDKLVALAQRHQITIEEISPVDLNALCGGGNHQGVALEGRPFVYKRFEKLLASLEGKQDALVVILDQVTDPMNLGAIIRSAAACGADGVILPERRSASVNSAVLKTSAGQALKIPIAQVTNLNRTIEDLKEAGFWVGGAATRNGQSPWEIDMKGPVALVMGSEGKGMRRLVEKNCDFLLTLPLSPEVESLNVSAAASMMLYEVVRQRKAPSI